MDLLLQKRYNLDAMVTTREKERRANDETSSDTSCDKRYVRSERGRKGEGERSEGGGGGGRGGVTYNVHVHVYTTSSFSPSLPPSLSPSLPLSLSLSPVLKESER